jgi:acetolactate synthase I/II/III large subunit
LIRVMQDNYQYSSLSNSTDIESNLKFEVKSFSDNQSPKSVSVAEAMVKMLENMGVIYAFGVSGGAICPLWINIQYSSIQLLHCRHETGAAFAAVESYFASGRPAVVLSTTGPGITNALTGLVAARWEGAKVIFLSPSTSASQRGRWAFQETSAYTMPASGLFTSNPFFHYAVTLETATELPEVARRLAQGFARAGGFVASISVPTDVQTSSVSMKLPQAVPIQTLATASESVITECVKLLSEGPFALWIGFGARGAAKTIREFAERTGAAVMCSPRGKGIFPEEHSQFIGVTGFGEHTSVLSYMQEQRPLRTLVLGTRLGEMTSFWNPTLIPKEGFIHVDIDPEVPGTAYPSAETLAVHADVETFMKALLKHFPDCPKQTSAAAWPHPERKAIEPRADGLVRPEVLMEVIQEVVVEGSKAIVMTEAGNSFAWGTHLLRFNESGRYRVSTGFGSMGHAATGVVGSALAHKNKAVAIVGDGAMLMSSEISTAVRYQIPAVWIVLNDGRYNMIEQGAMLLGFKEIDLKIPQADFVMYAHSMGADGIRVDGESNLKPALEKAMAASVAFIVDVLIDPTQTAPSKSRNQSLFAQGIKEL